MRQNSKNGFIIVSYCLWFSLYFEPGLSQIWWKLSYLWYILFGRMYMFWLWYPLRRLGRERLMRHLHVNVALKVLAPSAKRGFISQNIYKRQKRLRYYTNTMLAGFNFTIQYTREGLYIHIDLIKLSYLVSSSRKKIKTILNFKWPFGHFQLMSHQLLFRCGCLIYIYIYIYIYILNM